jgi:hypothetical protein
MGLLAERAARLELPNALLAPVGLCATVALVMPLYWAEAGAWLATPVAAAAAVAGYVWGRGTLRERLNPGWAGVAALGAYVIVIAPVVGAGGWTWTGYNFVNDTSVQLLLADHLAHDGMSTPLGPPEAEAQSTGLEHIRVYRETGYPLGVHAFLATVRPLGLAPFEAVYQPLIGLLAAMAALSLAWLLQRVTDARLAAAGALMAVAGNLVYQYALQGSVKEIGMLAGFGAAVAVARHVLEARVGRRAIALLGLLLGVCVLIYSTAALPYVGTLAVATAIAAVVQRNSAYSRRDVLRTAPVAIGVAVVAALPALFSLVRFGEVAEEAFDDSGGEADLAHLLRPLKLSQAAGVWLNEDYRRPVVGDAAWLNDALIVLVVLLAVAGVITLVRRRELGIFMYALPAAVALIVVSPRVSSYADAKLLVLFAPAVVLFAWAGVAMIHSARRPVAIVLAVVVGGAVMWSDGLAYHRVQLAPVDRLKALEDIGERYEGKGLMLVNDFEQFAKYFMRDARENVAAEAITPYRASDSLLLTSFVNLQIDVDQESPDYLQHFPWIVERKGADASRPPANYRLEYENRFYTVWARDERIEIVWHEPFQRGYFGAIRPSCEDLLRVVATVGEGEEFAVSVRPIGPRLDVSRAHREHSWRPHGYVKDAVVTERPGSARGFGYFAGGMYRIWVLGSFGRDLAVLLDTQEVGRVRGVNTEGEWLDGSLVEVPEGRHEIAVVRGGGNLAPGDGFKGTLGPVAFQPVYPTDSIVWAKPDDVRRRVCGRDIDWMAAARR